MQITLEKFCNMRYNNLTKERWSMWFFKKKNKKVEEKEVEEKNEEVKAEVKEEPEAKEEPKKASSKAKNSNTKSNKNEEKAKKGTTKHVSSKDQCLWRKGSCNRGWEWSVFRYIWTDTEDAS